MHLRYAAVAAAIFIAAPATYACAQEAPVPLDPQTAVISAATNPVKHVLIATYLDEGDVNAALKTAKTVYTFGNVITFTCTAACTLEFNVMAQIGQNKTAKNLWDICATLNLKTDPFVCAFQGTLPVDGSYVIGNYSWSVPLAKGAHTVQPTVYVTSPATLQNYHAAYRVYQP
jgi:hypothetical protein